MVNFLRLDITSKENAKIKYIKRLISDASFRKKEKYFVIEGFRLCYDAFLSRVLIDEIYYTDNAVDKFTEGLEDIIGYSKRAYRVSESVLKNMSDTKTPQGVVCVCEKLDKQFSLNTINSVRKFIILENIQDPANLGTILRTAEALGINFVVMSGECCDVYNSKVLRGSMGAVFRVNILFSDNLCDVIKKLQDNKVKVYAAVPDASATLVTDVNWEDFSAVAIAIGNEGNGLTREVIDVCNAAVTIPMHGRAESLNAAMAAGILMWEMMRGARE